MITFTQDSSTVTFETPQNITNSTAQNINTFAFTDGTDTAMNIGKAARQLNMRGYIWETTQSDIYDKCKDFQDFMDDGSTVALTGMSNNNMNDTYQISDFGYSQVGGHPNLYSYNITIDRIHDRLG